MTRVKICGIRRVEDAVLASSLGADAIGFIFWPRSPRFIDPFRSTRDRLGVAAVRDDCWSVRRPARGICHGRGADAGAWRHSTARERRRCGICSRARHEPSSPLPLSRTVTACPLCVRCLLNATVLLDAHDPIKRGGTGRAIDWKQAAAAAKVRPVILSGGLNADNVGDAVAAVSPYAIDVSSGVESAPGIKDADKLRALFAALAQREARII